MTTIVRRAEQAAPVVAVPEVCVLCQSRGHKLFLDANQRTVIECQDCGLRAPSPMPTVAHMVEISEETVHPFFNAAVEDEESYRTYFEQKLDELQRLQSYGRLLDVGCGAGFFPDAARSRGFDVSGVDLSPVPAAHAREQLGLDVTVSSLYGLRAASGTFAAVTIFQTIEHDADPATLCQELHRIVKPGGVVMVTTPAAHGLVARVMGRRWFGYRNVEHVSLFSRQSLRHALESAGFEIEFSEIEHGKKLSAKYVLNRLINYYYDHRTFLRNGLRLLHSAMLLLGKLPLFEPWAHLYAVARKPGTPSLIPEDLRA